MNINFMDSGDTAAYYWVHQVLASAIWGLGFFFVGLLLAALLWGGARRRANAQRIANQKLLAECQKIERANGDSRS
ncbi:MAG: hypothetical protein DVB23_000353 [Verrucomicrobia bacterium]|jgi:hypothetical protein|nr:MAG: hypothetical protein DVB23_000353 [Verrucomicrobiota bacterium]